MFQVFIILLHDYSVCVSESVKIGILAKIILHLEGTLNFRLSELSLVDKVAVKMGRGSLPIGEQEAQVENVRPEALQNGQMRSEIRND